MSKLFWTGGNILRVSGRVLSVSGTVFIETVGDFPIDRKVLIIERGELTNSRVVLREFWRREKILTLGKIDLTQRH